MSGPLKNSRHELFCCLISQGVPQHEAYKAAGYQSKTRKSQIANAYKLMIQDDIRSRISDLLDDTRETLKRKFADRATSAFDILNKIAADSGEGTSARITAAKHILGLAGYSPVERIATDHNISFRDWVDGVKNQQAEAEKENEDEVVS